MPYIKKSLFLALVSMMVLSGCSEKEAPNERVEYITRQADSSLKHRVDEIKRFYGAKLNGWDLEYKLKSVTETECTRENPTSYDFCHYFTDAEFILTPKENKTVMLQAPANMSNSKLWDGVAESFWIANSVIGENNPVIIPITAEGYGHVGVLESPVNGLIFHLLVDKGIFLPLNLSLTKYPSYDKPHSYVLGKKDPFWVFNSVRDKELTLQDGEYDYLLDKIQPSKVTLTSKINLNITDNKPISFYILWDGFDSFNPTGKNRMHRSSDDYLMLTKCGVSSMSEDFVKPDVGPELRYGGAHIVGFSVFRTRPECNTIMDSPVNYDDDDTLLKRPINNFVLMRNEMGEIVSNHFDVKIEPIDKSLRPAKYSDAGDFWKKHINSGFILRSDRGNEVKFLVHDTPYGYYRSELVYPKGADKYNCKAKLFDSVCLIESQSAFWKDAYTYYDSDGNYTIGKPNETFRYVKN
ncbi:hypothetical protein [Photobacterium rosenbergii]|uniref:hypothetical protein n=1 Tax=Photobacterium rosenbergii TaxID=294936 RepID=UPI001C991C48|nr:hypothetical protein [Photobacterium rosenbergii]MBY5948404.1 hypothetical protein [Photobacterium rosenbergii]